ncbi:MAG TPA: hypothetical protein VF941_14815, partial [Clostridia bacterium]
MKNNLKMPGNYYPIDKKCDYGNLVNKYVIDGHDAFYGYPLFIYGADGDIIRAAEKATDSYFEEKGSSSPAGKYSNSNKEYRTLGFTREGLPFPNPWFPPDYCVHGENNNDHELIDKIPVKLNSELEDSQKYWIQNPFEMKGNGNDKRKLSKNMPELKTGNVITVNKATADMINSWVRVDTFNIDNVRNATNDKKYFSNQVVNPPKSIKDHLEDYLAVISPPTDYSWGIGVAFYYLGPASKIQSRYSLFYLKPIKFGDDISAQFEDIPSSAEGEDDVVTVGVKVKSTFDKKLSNVGVKWQITKKTDGTVVPATYLGYSIAGEGNIPEIPSKDDPEKGERMLYASFKMPNSDVNVKFEINKDGKNPEEITLDNNSIEALIKVKYHIRQEFDLDYNILTRKVMFPLANGDIKAELSLPEGSWNGNATGTLGVNNEAPDLFKDFKDMNNDPVNEDETTIRRAPQIHTTFRRIDFGDDPQHGNYLSWPNPWEPKERAGDITFSGSVSRPYKYTYHSDDKDSEETGYGTANADFNSGINTTTASAL